ncbi:MAG: hypothetical protein IKM97_06195 [Clostridia bacterium]|nr:hypothetical protein [Clostridia bacterium]
MSMMQLPLRFSVEQSMASPLPALKKGDTPISPHFADLARAMGLSAKYINDGGELRDRTAAYFTRTERGMDYSHPEIFTVNTRGEIGATSVTDRGMGIRPCICGTSIDDFRNIANGEFEVCGDNVYRFKLFMPLTAPGKTKQDDLHKKISDKKLRKVKGTCFYTYPGINDKPYTQNYYYYDEDDGELYLLLNVNRSDDGDLVQFSNGEYYKNGDSIFLKVEESDWYVSYYGWDIPTYQAISDIILFSGVPVTYNKRYGYLDYLSFKEDSIIQQYLDISFQGIQNLQSVCKKIINERKPDPNLFDNSGSEDDKPSELQELRNRLDQLELLKRALESKIQTFEQYLKNNGLSYPLPRSVLYNYSSLEALNERLYNIFQRKKETDYLLKNCKKVYNARFKHEHGDT